MVQGKIEDERVRRVRGLPPTLDPLSVGRSFLCDQLGLTDITLDKCWVGHGDILFIKFLSLADRFRALRAKRNLFSLHSKIFLDEDFTKAQVTELKHARSVVVEARLADKWAVIRNLKVVIRDSPPVAGKRDRPPRPNDGPANSRIRGRPPLAPLLTVGMVMALYGHYPVFCAMMWGPWIFLSLLRLVRVLCVLFRVLLVINGYLYVGRRFVLLVGTWFGRCGLFD